MTIEHFRVIGHGVVSVLPGTYVLGDPCYAVAEAEWHDLLESCDYFGQAIGTLKDKSQVLAFHTAYGDGEYPSNIGAKFPVDAGLIGLVPVDSADMSKFRDILSKTVTFTEEVLASFDAFGMLKFGYIEINTGDEPMEDDEEEEDWS